MGMIVLRLVHVVLGASWVGMMVYQTFFLGPAMQEAGPDAGKVMAGLQRRRIMFVMPGIAILTLVSGFWLYWRVSAGFQPDYSRSRVGMAFGAGGVASLLAFVIGMTVVRPAMMRTAMLMQSMASRPESERAGAQAEVQRLRTRGALGGNVVATLLLFTLAAMAVARYL